MHTIYEDSALRQALHAIYVAQFDAMKSCPQSFKVSDATRMLTGLMGSRPWSWRVVGITPAALNVLAQSEFKLLPRSLHRGHRYQRSLTAQALFFDRAEAMPLREFFEFFLPRDETVIMTRTENAPRAKGRFPAYIPIDRDLGLFPCAPVVGWSHGEREVDFLRALHATSPHGVLSASSKSSMNGEWV